MTEMTRGPQGRPSVVGRSVATGVQAAEGGISLPGMLDIGTSAYTNSRIRCNAEVGGYTGYAELKAASSYDMFVNLSTTRTDGGWMYFEISNNGYIQ